MLWNVTNVKVEKFFIKQPQLWALNIMNGTNLVFDDIYVNATATEAPWGSNWVQNTDGFGECVPYAAHSLLLTGMTHGADTMDAHNVSLSNFIFQGGDDCVAVKPRSYNIQVQNVTCRGGNGIAIGSLGQYLEDSSVVNVTVSDVKVSERRYLRLSSNIETDNSVQRRYA